MWTTSDQSKMLRLVSQNKKLQTLYRREHRKGTNAQESQNPFAFFQNTSTEKEIVRALTLRTLFSSHPVLDISELLSGSHFNPRLPHNLLSHFCLFGRPIPTAAEV